LCRFHLRGGGPSNRCSKSQRPLPSASQSRS
jgi:hypothetical protein